jgi:hypothetical protein
VEQARDDNYGHPRAQRPGRSLIEHVLLAAGANGRLNANIDLSQSNMGTKVTDSCATFIFRGDCSMTMSLLLLDF